MINISINDGKDQQNDLLVGICNPDAIISDFKSMIHNREQGIKTIKPDTFVSGLVLQTGLLSNEFITDLKKIVVLGTRR